MIPTAELRTKRTAPGYPVLQNPDLGQNRPWNRHRPTIFFCGAPALPGRLLHRQREASSNFLLMASKVERLLEKPRDILGGALNMVVLKEKLSSNPYPGAGETDGKAGSPSPMPIRLKGLTLGRKLAWVKLVKHPRTGSWGPRVMGGDRLTIEWWVSKGPTASGKGIWRHLPRAATRTECEEGGAGRPRGLPRLASTGLKRAIDATRL